MLELISEKPAGPTELGVGGTLDDLARAGAQRMIAAALQLEVDEYPARFRAERDPAGHALVVRNGTARPRPVTIGVGPLTITALRVNDGAWSRASGRNSRVRSCRPTCEVVEVPHSGVRRQELAHLP